MRVPAHFPLSVIPGGNDRERSLTRNINLLSQPPGRSQCLTDHASASTEKEPVFLEIELVIATHAFLIDALHDHPALGTGQEVGYFLR